MLREDLWVVNDRRSIEPSIITLPYDDCIHLERTLRGTFACQRPSGGTDLKAAVIRDGGVLATFAEARLATAGNAIWISSDSALSRGLDTGDGSLEMSPPVATGFYGPESFAATEDAVLRQHVDSRPQIADSFQLFELDGGALTLTAELSVSMSEQVTAMVFSRDAGTALIGAAGRWARVPLTSGASSVSLNWAGGSAIYRHGAALWVRLDDSNWHLIPADPAQAEISFNAPFGWVDPTSRSSTTNLDPGINADGWPMLRPMVNGLLFDRDQVVVPTFTPEGVLFSLYKAPQDAQIIEISQGQLRAIRGFEQLSWPIEP
jgi:hypothetical protein